MYLRVIQDSWGGLKIFSNPHLVLNLRKLRQPIKPKSRVGTQAVHLVRVDVVKDEGAQVAETIGAKEESEEKGLIKVKAKVKAKIGVSAVKEVSAGRGEILPQTNPVKVDSAVNAVGKAELIARPEKMVVSHAKAISKKLLPTPWTAQTDQLRTETTRQKVLRARERRDQEGVSVQIPGAIIAQGMRSPILTR